MDVTRVGAQIEQMLPDPPSDARIETGVEEALAEVRNHGSCSPLLRWAQALLASERLKELARLAARCCDFYPNSGLSYQMLKLLLESDHEILEAYALVLMSRQRPIPDLKERIIYLRDRRSAEPFVSVLPIILDLYESETAFHKRSDGYLEFESVFDLVTFVGRSLTPSSWIYRGHADSRWLLLPNMLRPCAASTGKRASTQPIEVPFPQATRDFIEWLVTNDRVTSLAGGKHYDFVEALAIAQHYGFPTPFLDFSKSLRVAAFFATHPPRDSGCGVVYCINLDEMKRLVGDKPAEKFAWVKGLPSLVDREFPGLRRIQTQEGVFVHSVPAGILADIAVTRYYFKHTGIVYGDEVIREEYIYPPEAPLEVEIGRFRTWYTGYRTFAFEG